MKNFMGLSFTLFVVLGLGSQVIRCEAFHTDYKIMASTLNGAIIPKKDENKTNNIDKKPSYLNKILQLIVKIKEKVKGNACKLLVPTAIALVVIGSIVYACVRIYNLKNASNGSSELFSQPEAHDLSPFKVIVVSDIHCGKESLNCKSHLRDLVLKEIDNPANNVKAVIFAGDLTDSGKNKEFQKFKQVWIDPIRERLPDQPHGGVYLGAGNHDEASAGLCPNFK